MNRHKLNFPFFDGFLKHLFGMKKTAESISLASNLDVYVYHDNEKLFAETRGTTSVFPVLGSSIPSSPAY